jgi:DNA-binding transcriptional LysR family regulator
MDELRLLRVFREVALRGSFSAAAQALAYTQPAVSQQIARLERDIGERLIEREPKGLRLTMSGEVLLRHTERIMSQLAHAEAELKEVGQGVRGRVRVSAFPTAAGTFVARAFSVFRRERPGVEVTLTIAFPLGAVESVRRGEAEIAITQEGGFGPDPDHAGLHLEHLLDDALYAALPAEHPLATRRTITPRDLAQDPLVLLSAPDAAPEDNVITRVFRDAGVEPKIAHTTEDHFAAEGLVASGMGVALIPGLALAATRTDIAIRPLRGRPPTRRILAAAEEPPRPAARAMLDALREAAAAHVTP